MAIQRECKYFGSSHKVISRGDNPNPIERDSLHLVCGPTGSGKSQLCFNLIEEFVKVCSKQKIKPRVIVYSGSPDDCSKVLNPKLCEIFGPDSEQSFRECITKLEADALKSEDGDSAHSDVHRLSSSAAKTLLGGSGEGKNDKNGEEKKKKTRTFLVVDDAIGTSLLPSKLTGSPLGSLIIGHRHYDSSVVICSQKWTMIPTLLRGNASYYYIFPTRSEAEQRSMSNELPVPKEVFQKAMRIATSEEHGFIFVNTPDGNRLFLGFRKPLCD